MLAIISSLAGMIVRLSFMGFAILKKASGIMKLRRNALFVAAFKENHAREPLGSPSFFYSYVLDGIGGKYIYSHTF